MAFVTGPDLVNFSNDSASFNLTTVVSNFSTVNSEMTTSSFLLIEKIICDITFPRLSKMCDEIIPTWSTEQSVIVQLEFFNQSQLNVSATDNDQNQSSTQGIDRVTRNPEKYFPTTKEPTKNGLISDDTRTFFETLNFCIFSGIISFLGSVTNVLNIIVFTKQGFGDSVNITLFGLAISDLGALLTLLWMSICFNPFFFNSGINFDSKKVQYLTAGWPHVCFARITSWLTAFVTFERCLCIALPLKVKTIITPRRTVIVVVSIFITLFAAVAPVYYAIGLGPVYDEEQNETLIGLVYRSNGNDIENISFAINVFAQFGSIVIVIVCTIILVRSLARQTKWRQSSMSPESSLTSRDKRLVKMILMLSAIFITCFLPTACNLIAMLVIPEYTIVGQYANTFQVGWSFLNTLEAANSSVNIFVYYKMSSRYRFVFQSIFCPSRYTKKNCSRDVSTLSTG